MKRARITLLAIPLLLILAARPEFGAGAQPTLGFVGSWRVVVSPDGAPSSPSLVTFLADGTVLVAVLPAQPAPAGSSAKLLFSSEGHGVWTATGPGTAAFTFTYLQTDEQGRLVDIATSRSTARLAPDGQSYTTAFVRTTVSPSGKVVGERRGTVQATRMVIQPEGSPAANPSS